MNATTESKRQPCYRARFYALLGTCPKESSVDEKGRPVLCGGFLDVLKTEGDRRFCQCFSCGETCHKTFHLE